MNLESNPIEDTDLIDLNLLCKNLRVGEKDLSSDYRNQVILYLFKEFPNWMICNETEFCYPSIMIPHEGRLYFYPESFNFLDREIFNFHALRPKVGDKLQAFELKKIIFGVLKECGIFDALSLIADTDINQSKS